MSNPLVSVCVITYNQEKTISQTIDSILNQNVDFPIEVIIGEDCSTDDTRNICLSYKEKYPDIIKLILHEHNQGLLKNYNSVISACTGKYIAQCAGDDYWHNPDKLKIQVKFLENNLEYGVIHSNVRRLKDGIVYHAPKRATSGYVFEDLLKNGNSISALSVMFSRNLLSNINMNEYIENGFLMEDYPLWLDMSNYCKFKYIDKDLATYRVGENSLSRFSEYEKAIEFQKDVFKVRLYSHSKYKSELSMLELENKRNKELRSIAIHFGKYKEAIEFNKKLETNCVKGVLEKCLFSTHLSVLVISLMEKSYHKILKYIGHKI